MKRLLILQHVPSEILGTLNTLLKGHGFRIRYVNFGRYPDARPVVDRYNGPRADPVGLGTHRAAACDWLRIPSSDATGL